MKINHAAWLWHLVRPHSMVRVHGSSSMPAHKTVQTPLAIAGAMGVTKHLLPWLGVRRLVVVEGLMISSLSFFQIAFFVIRNPLLFDHPLLPGFFQLSSLFLASPMPGAILGGLVIGYLVTGVVPPGKDLPKRWRISQTLRATGIAVLGGLVGIVPMILGVLNPNPLGYGLIAAGFFLGPWLRAQGLPQANRSAAPSDEDSSLLPKRRKLLRSVLVGLPYLVVGTLDGILALSVKDNWILLEAEKTHVGKSGVPIDPSDDKSIKVASLSTGLIRYRVVNPQGRNLVLGFHGFLDSLEVFPPELETKLKSLDIQGVFLDRPGIGPVSTRVPGLNFETWSRLVEEFVQKVFNNQPISIIGHSAGGLYALACAKLPRLQALALVCSITPMTFASLLRNLYHHVSFDPAELRVEFFPHLLIPVAQQICDQIHNHDFQKGESWLGPEDKAFVTQNKEAFRKNTETSIAQGAESIVEDVRGFLSPWPLTPADTARIPILIFNGAGDQIVRPSVTRELHTHFAPHARVFPPFEGMGHLPTLKHYELIFAELGKMFKTRSPVPPRNPKGGYLLGSGNAQTTATR